MNRLKTSLAKIAFKNPVTVASGTFGTEYNNFFDINNLGAVVTKTITKYPKHGNPPPRLVETPSGMINSIGLQNPGLKVFCKDQLPEYTDILDDTPLIISFSGSSTEEFAEIASFLEKQQGIAGYEVNVSCPNVKNEGISFGVDPESVYNVVRLLKKVISPEKELIIKLTPNVTDIAAIAKAAVDGGCDSLALINTLIGMKIDWLSGKPLIGRGFGGLSGPAIMPVALYNVFKVAQAVDVPILAMGGISTYQDVLEFIYAGAHAVAVGTANFMNPMTIIDIVNDLNDHVEENELFIKDLINQVDLSN